MLTKYIIDLSAEYLTEIPFLLLIIKNIYIQQPGRVVLSIKRKVRLKIHAKTARP